MNLKEKVVIVTGGAKGIGKSIAEEFVRESCKVIILDVDSKEGKKYKTIQKEKSNLLMWIFQKKSKLKKLVNI